MFKLFRFLGKYKLIVFTVLLLVFVQSMAELYLPRLMADIVDTGVLKQDTAYIWRIGGIMTGIALLGGASSIAASYLSAKAAGGFARDVRESLFNRVSMFSLQEFDQVGTASLITRTTNDITQVQNVLMMMMRVMVMAPLMAIGGVIMAIETNIDLSIVLVVVIPLILIVILVTSWKTIPMFRAMQQKIDQLNLILRENLLGIRVIRAFTRTKHEQQRFDQANLDYTANALKVNRIMSSLMPIMMLIMNLAMVVIVWYAAHLIGQMRMQVGDLIAFIQYMWQIMFSIIFASMMVVMLPRAQASAVRINEVLQIQPSVNDERAVADVIVKHINVKVKFDRVSFTYPGAEVPALTDITFEALPGQITAIIGGTGSGKSTLLHLLLRFYDVTSGTIQLNGRDIRLWTQKSLRRQFGFVPQQAMLFSGTVADNIRYGNPDATPAQLHHAAHIAQAHSFIEQLEGGYEAHVAQGGTNLSGGQKQRLSIARAIAKQASIYLFDDSFSALDYKTDASLRAALKDELAHATVIIVAQRVSTIKHADRIIVMEDGSIRASGTHPELLANSALYREIVASQLTEEEMNEHE